MTMLTKGIYGAEFSGNTGPFGLKTGQMRGGKDRLSKNHGWYNKAGEKLGFGDLATRDIARIMCEIPEDELFITLGEQDSFWAFTKRTPGAVIGSQMQKTPEEAAPGTEYVAEHARHIFALGKAYMVDEFGSQSKNTWMHDGVVFHVIRPSEVASVMQH